VGNAVLRRGAGRDLGLWDWFRQARDGRPDRRDGAIVLVDRDRTEALRWTVRRAWPAAFAFSPLRGRGDEVLIETLELAVEAIELEAT
jgi:phage tail-like protein